MQGAETIYKIKLKICLHFIAYIQTCSIVLQFGQIKAAATPIPLANGQVNCIAIPIITFNQDV